MSLLAPTALFECLCYGSTAIINILVILVWSRHQIRSPRCNGLSDDEY